MTFFSQLHFPATTRRLMLPLLAVVATLLANSFLWQQANAADKPAAPRLSAPDLRSHSEHDTLHLPKQLSLAAGFDFARDVIQLRGSTPANVVSIAIVDPQNAFFCDYGNIYHAALDTGVLRRLPPLGHDGHWQPTGLFYHQKKHTLLVANFKGNNCLEFDLAPDYSIRLRRTISHPIFKEPENITASNDGRYIAIADYKAPAIHLLTETGELRWSRPVTRAHGVSFGPHGRTILATSLTERKVIRFNLKGERTETVGLAGFWGKEGYMYPTDLATSPRGQTAVLDAHTGKITILHPDLTTDLSLGGNGPGALLFNTPYGFCWKTPESLIVADMYKRRLVEVDVPGNTIQRIWSYSLPQKEILTAWPFFKEASSEATEQILPLSDGELLGSAADQVQGLDENLPRSQRTGFTMPLPHLPQKPSTWYGYYKKMENNTGHRARLSGRLHLYAYESFFRYINARDLLVDNIEVTLLGSGQAEEVLVIKDGIAAPLQVGRNFWLSDDYLVNDRYALPQQWLARIGLRRIQRLRSALGEKGTPPLTALHTSLFPELSYEQFRARLEATCISPESKTMLTAFGHARDTAAAQAAASTFLDEITDSRSFSLWEVFLANSMHPAI